MTDKQPLGELLLQTITDIEEVGGRERHSLVQVIGRDAYDRMMSKQRTADLVDRWIDAGSKAKPAATKALSIAIAKVADKPELVSRIQSELADSFDLPSDRSQKPAPAKPRPGKVDLAQLAKRDDLTEYLKRRQSRGLAEIDDGNVHNHDHLKR